MEQKFYPYTVKTQDKIKKSGKRYISALILIAINKHRIEKKKTDQSTAPLALFFCSMGKKNAAKSRLAI
ncbi:MAG TPA: hypothetical protein DEF78_04625 [Sphingobacterium sp.]|nr:hypothetical protein [Sphingobacterium sp.]